MRTTPRALTPPETAFYAANVLVVDPQGRVLMTERKDLAGHYSLPGGKLEPGEMPQEAAVRELLQETGFRVGPHALREVYRGISPHSGRPVVTYRAREWFGLLEPGSGEPPARWGTWDDLLQGPFGEYYVELRKAVGM